MGSGESEKRIEPQPLRSVQGAVIDGGPVPSYQPGDLVRTIVGVKGDRVVQTELVARVWKLGWHGDRGVWLYFLEGNSRRRHRWYLAEDLELVAVRGSSSL
jgi:hypothetical protein